MSLEKPHGAIAPRGGEAIPSTRDAEAIDLLKQILAELTKINIHLSLITDEEPEDDQ